VPNSVEILMGFTTKRLFRVADELRRVRFSVRVLRIASLADAAETNSRRSRDKKELKV
jgi:hypothetical protein